MMIILTFYRYLYETCRIILSQGGVEWLFSLRSLPYSEIQQSLQALPGIGSKVADCIALFSLNQSHIIPVDTHILTITRRDYPTPLLQESFKTLTNKIYREIQRIFHSKFGNFAGWTHSLLFTGELSDFKHLLPIELQNEMNNYIKEKRKQTPKKEKNKSEEQSSSLSEMKESEINNENKKKAKKQKKQIKIEE